jgi:hypothetical protein
VRLITEEERPDLLFDCDEHVDDCCLAFEVRRAAG